MPMEFLSGTPDWSSGQRVSKAKLEDARAYFRDELLIQPWQHFHQEQRSFDAMPLVNGVGLAPGGKLVFLTSAPLAAIAQAQPEFYDKVTARASELGISSDRIEWAYAGQNIPCVRPALGGDSISSGTRETGTIACMVKDSSGGVGLLGCSHVLAAPPVAGIGVDEHWQPGDRDGGTAADRIGLLHDYVPIDVSGGINAFDAALCLPDNPADCKAGLQVLGAIAGCNAAPKHNISVRKVGWQTPRVTHGTLRYRKLSHTLTFPAGVAIFDNQYGVFGASATQPFAIPGDSGALVVDDQNQAVGMVFGMAQGMSIAYVNPIEPILNHFNITIP